MTAASTRLKLTLRAAPLLAGAALAGGLAACGGDEDGGGEGSLTIYSGRSEEYVGPLYDRFEEQTGVELDVRYGDSAELAATLREEGENSPADLFFSQDAGALGALEGEGLLEPLDQRTLDLVDRAYRSDAGDWVGISGRARTVAYNTDAVSEDELPESVLDFTDERWKGRIGWAPTNASFQAFVTVMRHVEGEDATREWLEGIVANDPESYPDNEALRDAIAAGEVDVGLINHYYVAQAIEEEGEDYPVRLFFPPNGDVGSLVNVAGAGVVTGADDAETALELIEFALSSPEQQYFADEVKEYPLVRGVKADPTLVPLAEIEQPEADLSDLGDLQDTLTVIEESGAL